MLVLKSVFVLFASLLITSPSSITNVHAASVDKKVDTDVTTLTEIYGSYAQNVQPHLDDMREAIDSNQASRDFLDSNANAIADYTRQATQEIEPLTTVGQSQTKALVTRQSASSITSLVSSITGLVNSIITLTSSIVSLVGVNETSTTTPGSVTDLTTALAELLSSTTSIPTTGGLIAGSLGTTGTGGGLLTSLLGGIGI